MHRHLDLVGLDGQGKSFLLPHLEAQLNGLLNALQGFTECSPLAQTARNGWTLRNVPALFVLFNSHWEPQFFRHLYHLRTSIHVRYAEVYNALSLWSTPIVLSPILWYSHLGHLTFEPGTCNLKRIP